MPDEIGILIFDAFAQYVGYYGQPIADEQRAEFLAHVAHTIGYDLNGNQFDNLYAVSDAFYKQQPI